MNKLRSIIQKVESSGEISLISLACEGELYSALIINSQDSYLKEGEAVWMVFKETEVSIGKDLRGKISLRNRFPSTITAIDKGQLLSEIKMDFKGNEVVSIITTASCENLDLKEGDRVEGLLKTTELLLMQHD